MTKTEKVDSFKDAFLKKLSSLNACSKKGLVEMFDSSIGACTVNMPYGGKYQLTPTQTMIAKLPVLDGKCDTVTMMSYGMDPYLMSWSPYHGAEYAVLTSVAKIVSAGGDFHKIRFTFQEYFKRMTEDAKRWGEPMAALLGAYDAQIKLGLPSIGGKDSMSGTFNDIDVPPTLCSFAVDVAEISDVVTNELKKAGSRLVKFTIQKDEYDLPDFAFIMSQYEKITKLMRDGVIRSAQAVDGNGVADAVAKMAFGNKIGAKFCKHKPKEYFFTPGYGEIVAEIAEEDLAVLDTAGVSYDKIGKTLDKPQFECDDEVISMEEALSAWSGTLEKVFPTRSGVEDKEINTGLYDTKDIYVCKHKVAKPSVFIPVFPGTNCEYDTALSFQAAGADTKSIVFKI